MAGSFRKADIAGYHSFEDLALEEFPQIRGNLTSQIGAVIKHR